MNTKKIVITGGPGTGKTSIINELTKRGYHCMEEISRQITLKAREDGIEQLFLTEPLLFSELLLKGRKQQFVDADALTNDFVFLDRGIPDVLAYMDFIGDDYPKEFEDACKENLYDHVFILAPWQEIFSSDSERYENFEQAIEIHKHLLNTYKTYNYSLLDVPFGAIESRTDFILNVVKAL
ncbi:ATP-binding protein [Oceanihabitans sp. 2_MG-2023]|uniref:ATP-binding protein n=1 Tax=Oceanihabitans sp. 2_MG-2023 TaxID=3062661 RepID=UPI0026E406C9|nr:ATP-binding protein [Oceanihabitans sp. 2_MG-2023]MDO6596968.1 ATP-binding protein [Oceanihabitans sp. 2_MG-2023]